MILQIVCFYGITQISTSTVQGPSYDVKIASSMLRFISVNGAWMSDDSIFRFNLVRFVLMETSPVVSRMMSDKKWQSFN